MIKVQGIRKNYGSVKALDGISFEVPAGEILGFLGPNGAGKTTMMKILACFISPSEGTASVAGFDVIEESLEVRRRVGYLPESCPLYDDMTVFEYLEYVADARSIPKAIIIDRIRETMQVCGLSAHVDHIIGTLSKGFRQRVGIAQSMIHQPDVLVMDEPTSGLDPNQIVEIREVIRRIGQEKTVILSTHILSEVQALCGRIIIVDEGRIVADGSPEELTREIASDALFLEIEKDGIKPEDPRSTFSAFEGVVGVRDLPSEDTRTLRLRLESKRDLRAEVFKTAVDKGWVLLEMRRSERNLEDVFRQLTTEK